MTTGFKGLLGVGIAATLMLFALCGPVQAQQPDPSQHDIATTWPGVRYEVTQLQAIPKNRLLVVIRLYAKSDPTGNGTFIGVNPPIPPGTPPELIATGVFRPRAFSLETATIKDDLTQQTYATAPRDPTGPAYLPSDVLITLRANQSHMMTLQFPMPPPPPPDSPEAKLPHTISLDLPKAVGPIKKLTLPPATP